MPALLPTQKAPKPHVSAGLPTAAQLERCDAVLLLLPTDGKPPTGLPESAQWQALHQRSKPADGDSRSFSLANRRQTLALIGYCKPGADPFTLLHAAGAMAKHALGNRTDATRIALIAHAPAAAKAQWQEALYAALAAHSFVMPADKSKLPRRALLARVDIYGESKLDVRRAECVAEATNLARHLTALPPNTLDAAGYRRLLSSLARQHRLRLRWHGEAALARLGANAFLAVSRGNARRDAGIAHLAYVPARRSRGASRPAVALVGKGILFDTGGTNLKPHRSMLDMHTDMAGSAVALATLVAAARLRLPTPIDAWLAISENSIGPKAYRPQEVIKALNGTTIQVIHSDAEGRMALADTLALAARRRPHVMVDFATLTGACVYALTERMSGVLATDAALATQLLTAGNASGERLWQFPLPDDYDAELESPSADIAQCTVDGKGDQILAARFLKRFVPDDIPWAHIDLSAATRKGGLAHVPTEITGFGARLALTWLLDHRKA